MNKIKYEEANIEIVRLSNRDIIETSGEFDGEEDEFENPWG